MVGRERERERDRETEKEKKKVENFPSPACHAMWPDLVL